DVSSSICAHAASEIGASSRCRLFMRDVSFKRADSQRSVVFALGRGEFVLWLDRSLGRLRIVFGYPVQKCHGGYKKKVAGHGATEIEQTIVVAWWSADKHVLQHLLN